MKNKQTLTGFGYLILAASSYATFGVLSRLISGTFPAIAQNYIREAISISVIILLVVTKILPWVKVQKKDVKWLIGFAFSNSLVMILLYLAFNSIAIGTVYFLFYSTMTITGLILGGIMFKEKMTTEKYIAFVLVCVGLVVMFSSSFEFDELKYMIYSLLVGVMLGFHNNLAKKVSNIYHPLQIFFYASVASFIVSVVVAVVIKESIPTIHFDPSLFWMIVYGLVVLLADIFMIYGYRRVEAQIASMIMPSEAFIAALFGWILYKDALSTNVIVGGVLIMLAAIVPNLSSKVFKRQGDSSPLIKPQI